MEAAQQVAKFTKLSGTGAFLGVICEVMDRAFSIAKESTVGQKEAP
jgi:hypothetical protein